MKRALIILFFLLALPGWAVDLATDNFKVRRHELTLFDDLPIYKDPSLFLGRFAELYTRPTKAWELLLKENPLLTSVKGKVCLLQVGPPTEFKNFGRISMFYEMAEPRLRPRQSPDERKVITPVIIPVKLCGETAYSDSLGFVLEADLKKAQKGRFGMGTMPPSTIGNEIPPLLAQP